jgi:hypothetical protein
MDKTMAIQVCTILLTALDEFWREVYSPNLEGFDWWYGISKDWDINVFWCDKHMRLEGSLYPVDKDGNTKTDTIIPLTINDKAVII